MPSEVIIGENIYKYKHPSYLVPFATSSIPPRPHLTAGSTDRCENKRPLKTEKLCTVFLEI